MWWSKEYFLKSVLDIFCNFVLLCYECITQSSNTFNPFSTLIIPLLQNVVYETPNINRCFLIENNDTAVLKTEGVNLQVSNYPWEQEFFLYFLNYVTSAFRLTRWVCPHRKQGVLFPRPSIFPLASPQLISPS